MATESVRYAIIGAGPTGLGAALRLKELGIEDFVVLEAGQQYGGLAASFRDDAGFTWDIGGHVQFSHYRYFDELMNRALGAEGWLHHQRESWVWIQERFVPYPFQNNIRYLPRETVWQCLSGLLDANARNTVAAPGDFGEWIVRVFGQGIADVFMNPYNFKVWAFAPAKMSYQWIGERVAVTDVRRVIENILFEKDDLSWGPNNTFRFPKHGGTGAIWNAVAALVGLSSIRLQTSVVSVNAQKKTLQTANGETLKFQKLLSTIPLDRFVAMVDEAPSALRDRAAQLVHSSSNIVGIGLHGAPSAALRSKCWMYFPESNCPFYRVTVFSNYSPNNVPDISRYWSLMAEVSESSDKPVNRSRLVEDTIQGMLNTGLIDSREQVASTWTYSADYGYPTPSLERDAILRDVQPALERMDLFSRGRFGGWKYEVSNQDHSLMQGVEWANRMALGIPEVTYPHPALANANYAK